jgi:hypothetical protein
MLIIGGVMPNQMPIDEEPTAYTYDIDLGRWNSFSLPRENRLNRQGAGCTVTKNGTAYVSLKTVIVLFILWINRVRDRFGEANDQLEYQFMS